MPDIERRVAVEVRAVGRRLEGIAAPFDVETRIADFTEVIRAGAFADTLADQHDVVALVDHDAGRLLARRKSGSLRLAETRQGLTFDLDVPDTTLGRDVLTMAERGDLGGMSFSFRVRPNGETWQGRRRELRSVDLLEVSVIHWQAAYSATSVQARARMPARLRRALAYLETI